MVKKTKLAAFKAFKAKYPNAILLLRESEFYVMRFDDARPMADLLGLVLSSDASDNSDFCAFPVPSLDTYLPKIVRAGYRVCIADEGLSMDNK